MRKRLTTFLYILTALLIAGFLSEAGRRRINSSREFRNAQQSDGVGVYLGGALAPMTR